LIPSVGAAPCVYKFLIRPYCVWSLFTKTTNIFSEKGTHFESDEDGKLVDVPDQTIMTSQIQERELIDFFHQTILPSQIQEKNLKAYQVLISFSHFFATFDQFIS